LQDAPTQRTMTVRVGLLCFWLGLIWLFMFQIAPRLAETRAIKPLTQFINERNIDATALYYTEIEEFSEAEINMRNTMTYPPKSNDPKD